MENADNMERSASRFRQGIVGMALAMLMLGCPLVREKHTCGSNPPDPVLSFDNAEEYREGGRLWTQYLLRVANWEDFPEGLFLPAYDAASCVYDSWAADVRLHLYDASTNTFLYGLAGYDSPASLDEVWLDLAQDQAVGNPDEVYIEIVDVPCGQAYVSNTVYLEPPSVDEVALESLEMEAVPGGSYVLESTGVSVELEPYGIGTYETTNNEFAAVLNWALERDYLENASGQPYAGGDVYAHGERLWAVQWSSDEEEPAYYEPSPIVYASGRFAVKRREFQDMRKHPAVQVSWYGAAMFCNWLSEIEGVVPCYDTDTWELLDPLPGGYRLPSFAEWEIAAAWDPDAPDNGWMYAFQSDKIDANRCNYGDTNPLGFANRPYTTPVGYYNGVIGGTAHSVSPAGCYDMSGNVWEWCQEWNADVRKLMTRDAKLGPMRVTRGGSYAIIGGFCRTHTWASTEPALTSPELGFRVARSCREGDGQTCEWTVLAVTSFRINQGSDSTTSRTVTLNNICTGHPDEYRASESDAFVGAEWLPYSTAPTFELSSGSGIKVVHFKVRTDLGEESEVTNDSIVFGEDGMSWVALSRYELTLTRDQRHASVTVRNGGHGTLEWDADCGIQALQIDPSQGNGANEIEVDIGDDESTTDYDTTVVFQNRNNPSDRQTLTVQARFEEDDPIEPVEPRVTYPSDPGITWYIGNTETVTWEGFSGGEQVEVEIEIWKGDHWIWVSPPPVYNVGHYEIDFDPHLFHSFPVGDDFRIHVFSFQGEDDFSDSEFSIQYPEQHD